MPNSAIYVFMPQVSTVIILEMYSPHKNRVRSYKDLARNKLEENK